jgi:hypothetical protein
MGRIKEKKGQLHLFQSTAILEKARKLANVLDKGERKYSMGTLVRHPWLP